MQSSTYVHNYSVCPQTDSLRSPVPVTFHTFTFPPLLRLTDAAAAADVSEPKRGGRQGSQNHTSIMGNSSLQLHR